MEVPNSYEPKRKRFVLNTLTQAVAHAQSWDEIESGCEAIANALRIAQEVEAEALRLQGRGASLDQLKALGAEMRKEFEVKGQE